MRSNPVKNESTPIAETHDLPTHNDTAITQDWDLGECCDDVLAGMIFVSPMTKDLHRDC